MTNLWPILTLLPPLTVTVFGLHGYGCLWSQASR